MTTGEQAQIAMLPRAAASDLQLMRAVSHLINKVYAAAEQGIWAHGASRTSISQITGLTRARPAGCQAMGRRSLCRGNFGSEQAGSSNENLLTPVPSARRSRCR